MASIRIDAGGNLKGREREVMAAVNAATFEPLGLNETHNDLVIKCHEAGARHLPSGKSEAFCLVEIKTIEGRNELNKKNLRMGVAKALGHFGINDAEVKVIIVEIPRRNVVRPV